jgi:hypothetical protein
VASDTHDETGALLPWWKASDMAAAEQMLGHVEQLRQANGRATVSHVRELVAYRALYLDRECADYQSLGLNSRGTDRSPFNLTQGAVDSIHAKLSLSRPRPNIISVNGRWKQQRKATLLQRWIDGWFEHNEAYECLSHMLHDALIYGTGWLKVYGYEGQACVDRVWDGDLFTDPREERYGKVRTMYQVAAISKDVLCEQYPKHAAKIRNIPPVDIQEAMPFDDLRAIGTALMSLDLITVVEGWRLGPGPGKPGKRMVIAKNLVLESEDYENPYFPFVSMCWGRDPERARGQGLVERGFGVQSDLDDHASVIQEAYGLFVPKLMAHEDCNLTAKNFNDMVGQVFTYSGTQGPPAPWTPGAVSPDFLTREDMLKNRYFEQTGVGQMEASSMAPANLESGKAILAYQDVTSGRFAPQARSYERAAVQFAKLVLWVADGIAADGEAEHLKVYGKDSHELLDYKSVRMEPDDYTIRVMAASVLPDSIAGRLEHVDQLVKLGILTDPQQIRELLDMPDLERSNDLASAMRQHVEKEIDKCLDGEQGQPSSYLPPDVLEWGKQRANATYHLALLGGAEEDDPEAMEMLRTFIGAIDQYLTPPAPPEPAAPPMGGPAPVPDPGGAPPGPPGEPMLPPTELPISA